MNYRNTSWKLKPVEIKDGKLNPSSSIRYLFEYPEGALSNAWPSITNLDDIKTEHQLEIRDRFEWWEVDDEDMMERWIGSIHASPYKDVGIYKYEQIEWGQSANAYIDEAGQWHEKPAEWDFIATPNQFLKTFYRKVGLRDLTEDEREMLRVMNDHGADSKDAIRFVEENKRELLKEIERRKEASDE